MRAAIALVVIVCFVGGCGFISRHPEVPVKTAMAGVREVLIEVGPTIDDPAKFYHTMQYAFTHAYDVADTVETGSASDIADKAVTALVMHVPEVAPYQESIYLVLVLSLELAFEEGGELFTETNLKIAKQICIEGFYAAEALEKEALR